MLDPTVSMMAKCKRALFDGRFRSLEKFGALLLLLCCSVSFPALLFAEHTRNWRQSTYDEFLKGTATGVAVRSDGRLELSPRFKLISDADASYLWSTRVDSKGVLYAAGGSPAKVFRFDSNGKPSVAFESSDLAAQAITFDAKGNLYVGTSPDGKVYRVSASGEKSVFFDPKTKYIWDLLFGPDGTLYVATGDKGQVLAVAPDGNIYVSAIGEKQHAGQSATVITTNEQGVTTITGGGTVTAGTQQTAAPFIPFPPLLSSSIYHISPDGSPEELWTSRDDVVYTLALNSDGRLLAGTGNNGPLLAVDGRGVFAQLAKSGFAQITSVTRSPNGKIYLCTVNPGKV